MEKPLSVRVDEDLREDFWSFCERYGLNKKEYWVAASAALMMFMSADPVEQDRYAHMARKRRQDAKRAKQEPGSRGNLNAG